MQPNKYGVTSAIRICFRYAPGATLVKLLIEMISGALTPLIVLVVASFIDNALAFVNERGQIMPLVITVALMAVYYAYSQISQIIIRIADKVLENALREQLRPKLVQKQASISYALLENSETMDLITLVCGNAEEKMATILNTGLRIIRLGTQAIGTLSLLAANIWWMIPLFILSIIPITIIALKGGKAIYASDVITTKLTRRHYYLIAPVFVTSVPLLFMNQSPWHYDRAMGIDYVLLKIVLCCLFTYVLPIKTLISCGLVG